MGGPGEDEEDLPPLADHGDEASSSEVAVDPRKLFALLSVHNGGDLKVVHGFDASPDKPTAARPPLPRSSNGGLSALSSVLSSPPVSPGRAPPDGHVTVAAAAPPACSSSAPGWSAHAHASHLSRSPLSRPPSSAMDVTRPRPPPMSVAAFTPSPSRAGGFELLTGRLMPTGVPATRVPNFSSVLSVRAAADAGQAPSKRRLPFSAEAPAGESTLPFTAAVALDGSGESGGSGERIRMPLAGEILLLLVNPEKTPLHTIRLPYDLRPGLLAEPALGIRAYVRQRVRVRGVVICALQVRFVSPPPRRGSGGGGGDKGELAARRLFLQGDLKVVFSSRRGDDDDDARVVETDLPVLSTYTNGGGELACSV